MQSRLFLGIETLGFILLISFNNILSDANFIQAKYDMMILIKGFFIDSNYAVCHEASHVFVSKNAPYGLMAWQDCIPHPALNSF